MKKYLVRYLLLGVGVFLAVSVIISLYPIPIRVLTEYPLHSLLEEGQMMHECAECHEGENFHSCDTCHNHHGSATIEGIDFYSTLHITGDVPKEIYLPLNTVFLKEKKIIEKINIFDLLQEHGINVFEKIIFYTNDGGFVTVSQENLGEDSNLVPYEDGIRFIDESLHESTWLKSIVQIIIISSDSKFQVNNIPISYGELISEEAVQFTVEKAKVIYKDIDGGISKTAETAARLEGVQLLSLLSIDEDQKIEVITDSNIFTIDMNEAINSKISLIDDQIVVVFPNLSRKEWIYGVKEIRNQ
jgi:hypothetical protein